MSFSDTYDAAYKRHIQYLLPISLFQLLSRAKEHFLRRPGPSSKFLEIGCGNGSVFENSQFDARFMAIDISEQAIANANSREVEKDINFVKLDAMDVALIDEKFDLILDSHLFHCLGEIELIEKLLGLIHLVLEDEGLFVLETMVANGKFLEAYSDIHVYRDGYFIGDYPNVGKRIVFEQVFLEKLFVEYGFKIEFLRFPIGSRFVFDSERDIAIDSDPDVIQLILRKV